MSGRDKRAERRAAQFAKFRITELNLVPLVDTFVSIVFFALTSATVGELAPVVTGVRLPEASVGAAALQQLTLGIGRDITLSGAVVMGTVDAAQSQSTDPSQPLLIPKLYSALKEASDSIRRAQGVAPGQPLEIPIAIQGDKSMRYDLLARMMQTLRLAGFKNISLQVVRAGSEAAARQDADSTGAGGP
ncbi:MAG TPA: biopolymer transporter ExbD [Gemmatimonadaceae bacterium]|nr:biopolymer transporter ExbD [Gemmatimonadaceae bacterium]